MNGHKWDIIYRIAAAEFCNSTACPECVDVLVEARDEIERLRLAIRKIAEQDATLSVCDGNVKVTMDATLTDAEREAVATAATCCEGIGFDALPATLRGLLERLN